MSVMIPVQLNGSIYRINPLFNLRFFFPAIIEQAMRGLQQGVWEDWFADYLTAAGVTEEDLLRTWKCYVNYMDGCLASVDQETPREAMQTCGFLDCKKEARLVVLAKVGQIIAASLWWPLREGTEVDSYPDDMAKLNELQNKVFTDMVS